MALCFSASSEPVPARFMGLDFAQVSLRAMDEDKKSKPGHSIKCGSRVQSQDSQGPRHCSAVLCQCPPLAPGPIGPSPTSPPFLPSHPFTSATPKLKCGCVFSNMDCFSHTPLFAPRSLRNDRVFSHLIQVFLKDCLWLLVLSSKNYSARELEWHLEHLSWVSQLFLFA